jgi:hypothetical protein
LRPSTLTKNYLDARNTTADRGSKKRIDMTKAVASMPTENLMSAPRLNPATVRKTQQEKRVLAA